MRKSQVVPIALLSSLIFAFSASAGEWKKDPSGWRYDNGGGNYSARTWQWIDGNGDGIAECYYFDISGYARTSTTIDGSEVNADGAWVVNGIVQTKNTAEASENGHPDSAGYGWADPGRFNSAAGAEDLKGTLAYSQGTMSNITFLSTESFLNLYTADFTDVDGNQWLLLISSADKQIDELKSRAEGKSVVVYGKYDGYSEKMSKPSFKLTHCVVDGQGFYFIGS